MLLNSSKLSYIKYQNKTYKNQFYNKYNLPKPSTYSPIFRTNESVHFRQYTTDTQQKPMNFEDAKVAFKTKSNFELFRSLMVFWLCSIKPLVKNSEKLLHFSTVTPFSHFQH